MDAEVGRWTAVDAVRESFNPYSFVSGDPVNYLDPDGWAKVHAQYAVATGQLVGYRVTVVSRGEAVATSAAKLAGSFIASKVPGVGAILAEIAEAVSKSAIEGDAAAEGLKAGSSLAVDALSKEASDFNVLSGAAGNAFQKAMFGADVLEEVLEVREADRQPAIALYRKLGLFAKRFPTLAEANSMAERLNKLNSVRKNPPPQSQPQPTPDPQGQVYIGPISRPPTSGNVYVGDIVHFPAPTNNPNGNVSVGPIKVEPQAKAN